MGRKQRDTGQETKSKVVKSFADSNKKTLMKALPKGQYSKHIRYGLGVITESCEQRTSIDFDIHGIKKFGDGLFIACAASSSSVTSNTLTGELESVTIAGTEMCGVEV